MVHEQIPGTHAASTFRPGKVDAIDSRIDKWKRQLIDLSKRNRLLNFKPTKNASVESIDEMPSEVFRILQLENKGMTFSAGAGRATERNQTIALVKHDRANLPEKYTDNKLQTALPQDNLDATLLRLHQKSVSLFEEQGVNSLFLALGMLEWFDVNDAAVRLKAPLVLLPVELQRRGATNHYTLKTTEDDPVLNPAIAEKLRLDFKINLPPLPEDFEDLDPQDYFLQIQQLVAQQQRWRVTNEIQLSLFSFTKFLMYKEIENHLSFYSSHPIIQSLSTGMRRDISNVSKQVDAADLDKSFLPENTFHVLDADSSQQRAILAVRTGESIVIEGPPGTGKSQTIANIIADSLAEGKRVLFVSEKMAALDVVHQRLETNGLHDFCLKLHSHNTNKKIVYAELARVLDGGRPKDHNRDEDVAHLGSLREHLTEYAKQLHEPFGRLNISPFNAIGQLALLDQYPNINAVISTILEFDQPHYDKLRLAIKDHGALIKNVGKPSENNWAGSELTQLTGTAEDELRETLKQGCEEIANLLDNISRFADQLGAKLPTTLGEVTILCDLAHNMAKSTGTSASVLMNPEWNQMPDSVIELLKIGREFDSARADTLSKFAPKILEADLEGLVTRVKSYSSLARWFRPTFWRDRSTLRQMFRPDYRPISYDALLNDLQVALICQKQQDALKSRHEVGERFFGEKWRGIDSNWEELTHFSQWVIDMRQFVVSDVLSSRGIELACNADSLDHSQIEHVARSLTDDWQALRKNIQNVLQLARFSMEFNYLVAPQAELLEISSKLQSWRDNLSLLRDWVLYQDSRQSLSAGPAANFVQQAEGDDLEPNNWEPSFRRLFLRRWLDLVSSERSQLQKFQTTRHENRVDEFRSLDLRTIRLARQRLIHRLNRERDTRLVSQSAQLQRLQRELRKKARFIPLRRMFATLTDVVQSIKPCFMMSPLSVAQFLDPKLVKFDLVVFDEASQIAPHDAIGAIVRANQAVVVGDPKQLPPTNFFALQVDGGAQEQSGEDGNYDEIVEDVESILDEFATSGFLKRRLTWHYRSQHESLIAFSNRNFYNQELLTFPAPDTGTSERGLQFIPVPGVYQGKGINPIEARAVADAVCDHARRFPNLSLGVGTFNMNQQQLIQDEIDSRRREDPSIEPFFARSGEDRFFVKNLENIQGDDRDVIFISIGYGPDEAGKIRYNFGPVNGANGWRRLNVILTRAKIALKVFSSMRGDQIDPTRAVSDGAKFLREFLQYAERGMLGLPTYDHDAAFESPFEQSVFETLTSAGLNLVPQVGQAGYRIDFGVLDPEFQGRFLAGIECDGATYHGATTARDRDRLRQQVLENLGWRLCRIWSVDWYHNRKSQIERVMQFIEVCKQRFDSTEDFKRPTRVAGWDGHDHENARADSVRSATEAQNNVLYSTLTPAPPYRLAVMKATATSDDFNTATDQFVSELIQYTLSFESPIHIDELVRRVCTYFSIARAGNKVKERIDGLICGMALAEELSLRTDFIWRRGQEHVTVYSRAIDYKFLPEHISPEEYAAAIISVLDRRPNRMQDELVADTARYLGFARAGQKINELISEAIKGLIEKDIITAGATGLRLMSTTEIKVD